MTRGRLEAFSDGVIAILITIMVLELKVPEGTAWHDLLERREVFAAYVLSFVYVAIYWNNHHHMLHTAERVDGRVLWANTHLLFWLSLVPFATAWVGKDPRAPLPTACYGVVLFAAAIAYTILQASLIRLHGSGARLGAAVGGDTKGKVSLLAYATAIACAYWQPFVSEALYVLVALIWLVPDRRIERRLAD